MEPSPSFSHCMPTKSTIHGPWVAHRRIDDFPINTKLPEKRCDKGVRVNDIAMVIYMYLRGVHDDKFTIVNHLCIPYGSHSAQGG